MNDWLQGAEGVVDVIFGKEAPTGRLPVTFYYENYTSQVPHISLSESNCIQAKECSEV